MAGGVPRPPRVHRRRRDDRGSGGERLGRAALLALREKAKRKGWGMRQFHDALLGAGSLPPKLLEYEVGLAL